MDIDDKYKLLPIIVVKNNSFSSLSQEKSKKKIMSLINKYIIFKFQDMNNSTFEHVIGRLLSYEDNYLSIKPFGYTDYLKKFKKVHIDMITGLEQYIKYNPNLKFEKKFRNSICNIIDRDNNTITALVRDFNNCEVEFQFKYKDEDGESIGVGAYPICLLKEIKIL